MICYFGLIMIYKKKPENFNAKFKCAGCFIEDDGNILLLHRQDGRSHPNTYGIPGGKFEKGEASIDAIQREIKEETGYRIPKEKLTFFLRTYVRCESENYDFVYDIYSTKLEKKEKVILDPIEHKGCVWTTPKKALESLPLIHDLDTCIEWYYKINKN